MPERAQRTVQANGVDICLETFGERGDPALLLIMGSSASMDWWEDPFCERLADAGRYVIRYDHRDTGGSTAYPPGEPGYSGHDLVDDALGVLDALELPRAHVAGVSMGGGIAQELALEHPERVATLTLISTTAVSGGRGDLPGMSEATIAAFGVPEPDWSDDEAVVDHLVHLARVSASPARDFDEAGFREIAARTVARSRNIESSLKNHDLLHGGDDPPAPPLDGLQAPVLVLHGEHDPVFPYEHGRALAAATDAELVTLERTGHELPAHTWDVAVPAIVRHTA